MMRRQFLRCALVLVSAVLPLAGRSTAADDKKAPALTGTWEKKQGEVKLQFADKDVLKIYPHGSDVIVFVCKYTVDKDGMVKVKITGLEGKEEVKEKARQVVPVGLEFTFKFPAQNGTAQLSDVAGDKIDPVKGHLEGEYEKK